MPFGAAGRSSTGGLRCVVFVAMAVLIGSLVLRNPAGHHGAGTETARPRGAGQRQL